MSNLTMDSNLPMAKQAKEGAYLTNLRLFLWDNKGSTKPNNEGLFVFNFNSKDNAAMKFDDNTCRFATFKLQSLCYGKDKFRSFVHKTISRNNIVSTKDRPLLARQVSDYILSCFSFHRMDLRCAPMLVFVLDIIICQPLPSHCDQAIEQGTLLENNDDCVDGYYSYAAGDSDSDNDNDNDILRRLQERNYSFFLHSDIFSYSDDSSSENETARSSPSTPNDDDSINNEIINNREDLMPFYDDFSDSSESDSDSDQEVVDQDEHEQEGDELNNVNVALINGVSDQCLEANAYNLEEFNQIHSIILRSKYSIDDVATTSNKRKEGCDFDRELSAAAKRARVEEVDKSLVKVKPTVETVEAKEGDEMCSICLDKLSNDNQIVKMVRCDHMFHKHCIFKWLPKNQSCPYCRSSTITDVYLYIL